MVGPASSSSNAIDGLVSLAEQATGLQCVKLIQFAIKQQDIYYFVPLLNCRNIQNLSSFSPETHLWLNALRLFACGTVQDYNANPSQYPSSAQLCHRSNATDNNQSPEATKLQILSLCSYCRSGCEYKYSELKSNLEFNLQSESTHQSTMKSTDIESIVSQCVYAGLMRARIDAINQIIKVKSVQPRDVEMTQAMSSSSSSLNFQSTTTIQSMISKLESWLDSSRQLQSTLAEQQTHIHQLAQARSDASQKASNEAFFAAHALTQLPIAIDDLQQQRMHTQMPIASRRR